MGWDVALQGIGAGIKGGLDMYSWQQEHDQKDRTIDQRGEIEAGKLEMQRLRLELQEMIAELNESGRMSRHATPSGNTQATQAGAMSRAELTEKGRNERWMAPSGNATLGSETTRRGQDITSVTQRRGQDVSSRTTMRGQDLTFETNANRDSTTRRGQEFGLATNLMNEGGRQTRHRTPSASAVMRGVTMDPYASGGGTPLTAGSRTMDMRPGDQPPTSQAAPPNTPATAPRPKPMQQTTVDPQLAEQVQNLTAQFDAATDPDERAVLQNEMRRILQQLKGGR